MSQGNRICVRVFCLIYSKKLVKKKGTCWWLIRLVCFDVGSINSRTYSRVLQCYLIPRTSPCLLRQTLTFIPLSLTLAELAERYIAVVAWSGGKFIPRTSPCLLRQTLTFEPLSLTLAELTERYIAVVDWSRGKFIPRTSPLFAQTDSDLQTIISDSRRARRKIYCGCWLVQGKFQGLKLSTISICL